MSTQHPDNATAPDFAGPDQVLSGEEEIAEALHVYSDLGFDEQMWDYEGKDVDADVVMKLLSGAEQFFREKRLGRDVFLTFRLPNPRVELGLRKKAQEALHSIATSFDLAQQFYGELGQPPVFEVILPFTQSEAELVWVYNYYHSVVVGTEDYELFPGIRLKDWVGETLPKRINVIPLVEDRESLLTVDALVERYLGRLEAMGERPAHLRVFIARSDPALNYGLISAVLLAKLALQRLVAVERRERLPIYPILGVGGVPFRGNFRPAHIRAALQEYPSTQTFTAQSSFKYDHRPQDVRLAVKQLMDWERTVPTAIDEQRALQLVDRYTTAYRQQVERLAPLINAIAPLIPARRARRLHIGLYGYSRTLEGPDAARTVSLPRAITFCAALYSIGLPPELFALESLQEDDWLFLEDVYPHVRDELAAAATYVNEEVLRDRLGETVWKAVSPHVQRVDGEHRGLTSLVHERVGANYDEGRTREMTTWAAQIRGFLG